MQTLIISLKRPLRSITVEDTLVENATVREAHAGDRLGEPALQASAKGASTPDHAHRAGDTGRSMPTSVAKVLTDPSGRVVTPLAQSTAVPILSATTHEQLSVDSHGLQTIDPADIRNLKSMLGDAAEAVVELQEQHRQSLSELQEVAVELATAAASLLMGFAIERDMFAIDDLILKALQHMDLDQPVRVRLNPDDHQLLRRLMADRSSSDLLHQVTCEDAPDLVRGTCRVESGRRILLSDLNSRLEDIRRSWRETLDESQVERRGDGSATSTLRRFPDRRETA